MASSQVTAAGWPLRLALLTAIGPVPRRMSRASA